MKLSRFIFLILGITFNICLSGCGNPGALYLPEPQLQEVNKAASQEVKDNKQMREDKEQ